MANSAAVSFLQAHKDRYPAAVLQQQLRAHGYPESVVVEAMKVVYGTAVEGTSSGSRPGGFLNFRNPFVYTSNAWRGWDFIAGLVLGGALSFMQLIGQEFFYYRYDFFGIFAPLGIRLVLLVVLLRTRRWMMYGLLAASILAIWSLVYPIFRLMGYGYYH